MNEQNAAWPFFPWSSLAADLVTDMATLLALPTNTAAEHEPLIEGVGPLAADADASRQSDLVASAKRAMESLAKSDPEAAARIAREYTLLDSNTR